MLAQRCFLITLASLTQGSGFTSKSLLSCLLLFLLSLILSQALRQPQRPQSFLRQSKAITVRAGPALAAAAAPVRPRQRAAVSSGARAPRQPPDDGLANAALSSLLVRLFSAFPCSEPSLDIRQAGGSPSAGASSANMHLASARGARAFTIAFLHGTVVAVGSSRGVWRKEGQ